MVCLILARKVAEHRLGDLFWVVDEADFVRSSSNGNKSERIGLPIDTHSIVFVSA
jgi:hypothetical protein